MSDSKEVEEEETWSREEDELIPRYDLDDGDDQIPCGQQQQQKPGVSADRRKENYKMDKDTEGGSHVNRRKMQEKAKQLLISPVRRFEKRLKGIKNRTAESTLRRSTAPFPYDGEDFGGSPSRYLCFLPPSTTPPSASPMIHIGAAASSETPGAVNTVKPKNSSYYYFLKSLIEKNDFYTPECNVHRGITSSQPK